MWTDSLADDILAEFSSLQPDYDLAIADWGAELQESHREINRNWYANKARQPAYRASERLRHRKRRNRLKIGKTQRRLWAIAEHRALRVRLMRRGWADRRMELARRAGQMELLKCT